MTDKTQFYAYLPPIQTAIKITGNGDGARVQFDIPEMGMAGFIPVLGMRNQKLLITVETVDDRSLTEFDDETKKGAKNDPGGVDSRRIDLRRDQ
jgi:hypothetical protein